MFQIKIRGYHQQKETESEEWFRLFQKSLCAHVGYFLRTASQFDRSRTYGQTLSDLMHSNKAD